MTHYAALSLAVAIALASAGAASAGTISDPANDFLASYTGPQNGDMDVLGVTATTDGATLHLAGSLNGALGVTSGALYVFGIDRGTHNPRFGAFQPGVLFDAVVIGQANGTAVVRDFITSAVTNLAASMVHVSGSTIDIDVPVSLLPPEGVPLGQYGVNLWPRNGLGQNAQIADFAPDNAVFRVSFVPEPATIGLLGVALAGFGLTRVRRRG